MPHHLDTLAIHAGQEPDPTTGAIMTPIYQTSTYVQAAPAEHKGYEYSRTDNPTRTALQECVAAIEGGKFGLAFASGLAAIDTIMRLFSPGDHIIVGDDVYGGTFRLFEKVLARYGLTFSWVDLTDLDAVKAAFTPATRLLWLETPTNPMLRLADIAALAALAPERVLVAVDNTFCSPAIQQPLLLGADIVMHSSTKYLGGHSDVVGGVVALNDPDIYARLKFLQNAIGAVPGPMDCFLTLRGIKTLGVRIERHSSNATAVARMLEDHPAVRQVIYPGLDSHPQYALAQRQMRLPGGMLSVVLDTVEQAHRLVTRTKLFALAESLGGVESLIEHPYSMTHASTADSDIAVPPQLVRLSVGIEHVDDLIDDLRTALAD
ncbi:MAG: cystathionine gamma-synthase [Chloroflexi bacterium]|jgi:cystathionine beta-lyase/cystathionine gamma-synthase|nr:cystathionine gamma-synthase [Chloroflexota bacterium]MBV6437168.1 Cystathionine beta-lyase [Anaerolineae bacterium]MDL1915814.1 cystathionine gamma-synthase [Anaerolineae bacterium CFX4]OQY80030.1 MAG: cystathionine gamma-synthase [Anaerolineae bacterium UTCFX5]MCC6567174.1 cystathionine gamma-synthase [Chloroflexota bacterium]